MQDAMQADSSIRSYTPAPSQPLPGWTFHVVEYPGYVQNTKNALRNLGGLEAIEKAFTGDLNVVELRYRREDPFSHPINGEVINSANLLLKVTRRRRKKRTTSTSDPEANEKESVCSQENITAQIIGTVTKTCRFRAFADYQWLPDQTDPMVKLRKSMQVLDAEAIESFTLANDKGPQENLRNMPPPSFSRIEWPLDYGYKQNPAVVKVMVRGSSNEPPQIKLMSKYRPSKLSAIVFNRDTKEVPSGPPPGIKIADLPAEAIAHMKSLFEKRPIWTRTALVNSMPPDYRHITKRVMPLHGYVATSGPWRGTWVKYGYDPREDPEARLYQIIDVRFVKTSRVFARAKRLIGVAESSQLVRGKSTYPVIDGDGTVEHSSTSTVDPSTADDSHIFDGKTFREAALFQLCDITDPDMKKMIHTRRFIRRVFDEHVGWFDKTHFELMRETMKRKIYKLQGKDVDDNFEWEEGEPGPEDEARWREEEESLRRKQAAESTQAAKDDMERRVKSKVDELMRSLQAAQRGAEHDDETLEDVHIDNGEEEFDYYDVYGEDEDDDEED